MEPGVLTARHTQSRSYRATPDDELMLLLSNPYDETGAVYMLPFEPE